MFGSPLKEVRLPISGGTLTIIQFPVLRALRVGARVARMLAPVVAGLGGGLNLDDLINGKLKSVANDLDLDLNKAVPGALNAIATHMDPDELAAMCQELLSSAYWVDSAGSTKYEMASPGAIDMVLGGSLPDLFSALRGALDANNFFGLSAIGKLRGALGAQAKESPEPLTPN